MKGNLYIEGKLSEGASALADQTFAGVADGVEVLREGFHKLFEKEVPDLKINIVIEMGGPWTLTLKKLASKTEAEMKISLALIDYQDLPGDHRLDKIDRAILHLSTKGIALNEGQREVYKKNVFFMIQQMEGWFLSQPEIIEGCLKKYKSKPGLLKDDSTLVGKRPDMIKSLADTLGVLLGRYFIRENGKKLKYHKVKHAALFLEYLDSKKLSADFQDFNGLVISMLKIR